MSLSDREKQELRELLPEYLTKVKGINLGSNMKKPFLCIFGHEDKEPSCSYDPKRYRVKCFGCQASGDIFEIVGLDYNLPTFKERANKVCELFGRPIPFREEGSSPNEHHGSGQYRNVASNVPPDYDDYLASLPPEYGHAPEEVQAPWADKSPVKTPQRAQDRAKTLPEGQHTPETAEDATEREKRVQIISKAQADFENHRKEILGYFESRAIPEDIVLRFKPGYIENFKGIRRGVLIPTRDSSFFVRSLDPNSEKSRRYRKAGDVELFNADAITKKGVVFVVEGEIDAMSILSAGYEAVGLGSTSNIQRFLNYVKTAEPKCQFILGLDNDEVVAEDDKKAGKRATNLEHDAELLNGLSQLGYSFFEMPYDGRWLGSNDANDLLREDRTAFDEHLSEMKDRADEKALEYRKEYLETHSVRGALCKLVDIIQGEKEAPCPTGFPLLDEALGGGLYPGVYTIGAVTGVGKSAFTMNVADKIAASGRDVLVFALEMGRVELVARSLSRMTYEDGLENRTGKQFASTTRQILSKERNGKDGEILFRAIQRYSETVESHMFVEESVGQFGVKDIREAVLRHRDIMGKPPVVIVDYLQILAPYDVRASDKQNTDRAVLDLKRLSRDVNTPIYIISSLNRAAGADEVKLEHFKESGAIEYGSDVCLGLFLDPSSGLDLESRKNKEVRKMVVSILKAREGRAGQKIAFDYHCWFNYYTETGPYRTPVTGS